MDHKEVIKTALFDIDISSEESKFKIERSGIDYNEAVGTVEKILLDYPNDERLQKELKNILNSSSFGMMSTGGRGINITISARAKIVKDTSNLHTCPRRIENGMHEADSPFQGAGPNLDTWDVVGKDRVCSYCGSIHADDLISLVKEFGFNILSPTDKKYKWYIERQNVPNAGFGAIKLYTMHLNSDHVDILNTLRKP